MATQPKKAAVITGDVTGSSQLTTAARKKLQLRLQQFFRYAAKQWPGIKAEQFRGDSLQLVTTTHRASALRIALQLQSFLAMEKFYLRTAIGTGNISFTSNKVVTSDGTAFQASGRHLDELKKEGEVISIAGAQPTFTNEWQVHSASLDFLIRKWSPEQAEAIYLQLQHLTQAAIARKLNISQPSVHQRLQLAGGNVVQKILQRFEAVVPEL